jgi:hypothetical protein
MTLPRILLISALALVALAAPSAASAQVTLPGSNSWDVTTTVTNKDAAHTLAYGLSSPSQQTVCSNCVGGETLDLGTFAGGSELTTFMQDLSCGQTFLSGDPTHALVTQPSALEWRIGWDDSGSPCGITDRDFNDLVVTIDARYEFHGFSAPVDNPPAVNSVKAGSTIPVKFSLDGDAGLDIFAAGYPTSQPISCDSGALIDPIEETTTANASGLIYDSTADQYVYTWKTAKAWAGTCRELNLKLNDGSAHTASFMFK